MEVQSNSGPKIITPLPDKCPICHRNITPNTIFAHEYKTKLDVLLSCPNSECNQGFIAVYDYNQPSGYWTYKKTKNVNIQKAIFSESIKAISPKFAEIYNEAYAAEQLEQLQICGCGYRKSLEFLIKDYLISLVPENSDKIKKTLLGTCINNFVTNEKIKSIAKRAAWLGNDETHYERRWENKELTDLKVLIDITLHWIEMELLTSSYESDMPG